MTSLIIGQHDTYTHTYTHVYVYMDITEKNCRMKASHIKIYYIFVKSSDVARYKFPVIFLFHYKI